MSDFRDHIAYITKHSVAKTNRFQVIIPLPQELVENTNNTDQKKTSPSFGRDVIKYASSFLGGGGTETTRGLAIMLESTDIPGKSLTTTEVKYNGDFYKIPYANVYDSQQFTFKCSRDMYEKNILDAWMNLVFDPNTHEIGYMDNYTTNVTINQLNEQDEIVHSIILIDAYPSICTAIALSNDDRDNYARIQCQFMYKRWVKAEDNADISNGVSSLSQTPLGPILSPILSNPAVQRTLDAIENQTGVDLEGNAVDIYNQIDDVVKNSTGSSTNVIASIIESIKAQTILSGTITDIQKSKLIEKIDELLSKLRS